MTDRPIADLRAQLAAHAPADLQEARSVRTLLGYLDRLPRPFDRLASPVHVTGSAVVVGRRGVVLHLHKRLGIWLQPGGHLDPGETPSAAALREAAEETGLRGWLVHGSRFFHVDVHPSARGHVHLDLRYLVEAPDQEPHPAAGESQQARWFSLEEALRTSDPGLASALRSLQIFYRTPRIV